MEPVVCTETGNQPVDQRPLRDAVGHGRRYWKTWTSRPEADAEKSQESAAEEIQVASLQDMAGEAPVIRLVNSIFAQAIRDGASDVHISPQQNSIQLRFRMDGKLHEVPSPPKSLALPIIARMKILADLDITISRIPQDGRFTLKMDNHEINVRVSTLPTIYGENVVMRLLDMSSGVYTLDRLGMVKSDRDKIETMVRKAYGMILSTGPTGSGKSTSLYSILNELNRPDTNIITLEDPVEYRIANIRQVQLNRKAGMTFAERPPVDPPTGPGHHHGGGDPGFGNGGDRHPGRPDRASASEHPPYERRRRGDHPLHRHGNRTFPRLLGAAGLFRPASGPDHLPLLQGTLHGLRRPPWPPGGWIKWKMPISSAAKGAISA